MMTSMSLRRRVILAPNSHQFSESVVAKPYHWFIVILVGFGISLLDVSLLDCFMFFINFARKISMDDHNFFLVIS